MLRTSGLSLTICLILTGRSGGWTPTLSANDIFGENRIVSLCNGHWESIDIDLNEFVERDIAMAEINDGYATFVTKDKNGKVYLTPIADAESLVRRTACAEDTDFILIGKDSRVKKRWRQTLPMDDLFQTIDAMPMRQYEMKTRGAN